MRATAAPSPDSSSSRQASAAAIGAGESQNVPVAMIEAAAARARSAPTSAAIGWPLPRALEMQWRSACPPMAVQWPPAARAGPTRKLVLPRAGWQHRQAYRHGSVRASGSDRENILEGVWIGCLT
eukprot:7382277-Prymnesium_polylepis.1